MMSEKKYATPFPILQAASLLSHRTRIQKFRQAITKIVKSDHHVIDLGTGSGILAILAARQGARVTAIDANAESLKYAKAAAERNGVAGNIEFVHSHFYDFEPKEKADVVAIDPIAEKNAKQIFEDIKTSDSPYTAAKGADAIVLVTEWNEFLELDFEKLGKEMNSKIIIDGRNAYDKEKLKALGFKYIGVGR